MMTADGERMLKTLAQHRLENFERCPGPDPIMAMGGETICGRCSFEVYHYGERDWVHSEWEVATMRRMAAGGPWVVPE